MILDSCRFRAHRLSAFWVAERLQKFGSRLGAAGCG